MMNFKDRTAIVTGGTGNIGQAICRSLAKHGVRVAITDIDPQKVLDFPAAIVQ